ncbi:malate synthase G [Alphaproteobacteria bacterium]|nr:malate synthase G [Alphaproteobacteria bacterium]
MKNRVNKYELKVDSNLANFIDNEVLNDAGLESEYFWKNFSDFIKKFSSRNKKLLESRSTMKKKLDDWHINKKNNIIYDEYKSFLEEIGYLVSEGEPFNIETANTDPEISTICGPQLVVPITNARYALNAANARWGSFYDAIYGTDILGTLPTKPGYDEVRGNKVISYAKQYLDQVFPLIEEKWENISKIEVIDNNLSLLVESKIVKLLHIEQYVGYRFLEDDKFEIILSKNNLNIRIFIDPLNRIGKIDKANIADIYFEAAISTIMDCEDSVATVDGEDKVIAYKNWLGLMKGNLTAKFSKENKTLERRLVEDLPFTKKNGEKASLKGRSLMLIRNVGHLMTNPGILSETNEEIHEGLMDAMFTTLIASINFKEKIYKNSLFNSIYVVKPKMHGPEEVSFANDTFEEIEKILNLPKYTVKLGIMDEERRTSVNLLECIRAAKYRVAFINTGFLDRTGDEIHTSMEAGAFLKKGAMKTTKWIKSYENRNVEIGLKCGLQGKAQIGKGMWAMPDLMNEMLKNKIIHPKSGANCAWVPSPTAATIHAMHYHKISVKDVQKNIISSSNESSLKDLLSIPLTEGENWSKDEVQNEVDNNCQSILGYVVRWVDQGIGCSKVPDINDIGLMEDRATCRISSQILANWLKHGVIDEVQVISSMKNMAIKVDEQNLGDPKYIPMAPNYKSIAFKAACRLVLEGSYQPSGYTEPILHEMRLQFKDNL